MYRAAGKQVQRQVDGLWTHFADAISEIAAGLIAAAMNAYVTQFTPVDLRPMRITGHSVRQENDEYACSCGARWDVRDGEDHP